MVSLSVKKEQAGLVLCDLLEESYPDFDIKAIKAAFKARNIMVNGEDAYAGDTLRDGDRISIFVSDDVLGVDLTPPIIYQDENFAIVDKPAGLMSFSDDDELPNAVAMVEDYMKRQGEYSLDALMVPYLVYPLDKYVSGLLLLAKHEDAYLFLVEALAQRRIVRHFVCPVIGDADEGEELMAYHMTDKLQRRAEILAQFRKNAKPIVTRYHALAHGDVMSLVDVRPVTNGLHQIRAHLAYAGLPVVGDNDYGNRRINRKLGADHIALWLKSVTFEVGSRHAYEYLNKQHFESASPCFPRCVYDDGLIDEI